jgi:hypothetical protein
MPLEGDSTQITRYTPAKQKLIQACRMVAEIVSDPKQSLDPRSLARKTGYPESIVRYVIESEEFGQVLRETTKSRVGGILGKLATLTEGQMAEAYEKNPKLVLDAARTWSQVYERISKSQGAHEDAASQAQITVLMDDIEKGVFARKELQDESENTGKARGGPPGTGLEANEERDRAPDGGGGGEPS